MPSDVSGMSIFAYLQSGQSSLYFSRTRLPTAARIAKAETLTYTVFALPPLVGDDLGGEVLADLRVLLGGAAC